MVRSGASMIFFDVMVRYQTARLIKDAQTQAVMMKAAMIDTISAVSEQVNEMSIAISESVQQFNSLAVGITEARIEFEKFFQTAGEVRDIEDQIISLGEAYSFTAQESLSAGSRMAQLSSVVGEDQVVRGTQLGMTMGMIGGMGTEDAMKKMINLQSQTNFMLGNYTKAQYDAMSAERQGLVLTQNTISMMDALNSVENTSVATMSQIIDVMNQYASQAHLTGESIEAMAAQSALLIEAGEQQNRAGTALKMIYARLGGDIDGARSALGQYVETTDQATGAVKPLQELIKDLGPQWDKMGEGQKQALAQQIAGNRHYVRFIKLMENRTRLLELEQNAIDGIFPAMDERNKRLEDEGYQLLVLNAQLENRKELLAERMIPLLKEQRDVQVGFYSALIPLLNAEGNWAQKTTSFIAKKVIRLNEMVRIYSTFFSGFMQIQSVIIGLQAVQAVMRSLKQELGEFYNLNMMGQGASMMGNDVQIEQKLLEAQTQARIVKLGTAEFNLGNLITKQKQDKTNLTNAQLVAEEQLSSMLSLFYNEERTHMSMQIQTLEMAKQQQKDLVDLSILEVHTRAANEAIQLKGNDLSLNSVMLKKQQLDQEQKILSMYQLGAGYEYELAEIKAMKIRLSREEFQAEMGIKYAGDLRKKGEHELMEIALARHRAEQMDVTNQQQKVDGLKNELAVEGMLLQIRQSDAQQKQFYLDIMTQVAATEGRVTDIEAQKVAVKNQILALEREQIKADMTRLNLLNGLSVKEADALVLSVQKQLNDRKEVASNNNVAMSISNRSNQMMAFNASMMGASMLMSMFMDSEDAMQGQMIIMGITMMSATAQMFQFAKSMIAGAAAAKGLYLALGVGGLVAVIAMIGGGKLIPNMADDFDALGDSMTVAAMSAEDLTTAMKIYGDQSIEQLLSKENDLLVEKRMLTKMQEDADGAMAAQLENKIALIDIELGKIMQVTNAKQAMQHADKLAQRDQVEGIMDLIAAQKGFEGTTWYDDLGYGLSLGLIETDDRGTQEDLFDELVNSYEMGLIDINKLNEEWAGKYFGPDWLGEATGGADWQEHFIAAIKDDNFNSIALWFNEIDEMGVSSAEGLRDLYSDEWAEVFDFILDSGATTWEELEYARDIAVNPPENLEKVWNEQFENITKQSLTLIEEFANKREELFYGGRLGNLTGAMYKEVITQGVGTLYNHQEVIVANKFHGFFNPEDTALLIAASIEAYLGGRGTSGIVAAIS